METVKFKFKFKNITLMYEKEASCNIFPGGRGSKHKKDDNIKHICEKEFGKG